MSYEHYDLVVIGSGPAGYVASIRASQLGMKTACIEKDKTLGGTCLNVGCIPSKALLESSEKFSEAKSSLNTHGVLSTGIDLDLKQVMKRKNKIVDQLTSGINGLFKKNKVTWLQGAGKLFKKESSQTLLEVTSEKSSQVISANNVLIATGSVPVELPFLKFNGKTILSSTEALSLDTVPKHLIVIGGGVIGLELGSVWLRYGSKVTVIEFLDRILPGMDQQVSSEMKKILTKQGMTFHLSTKCLGATTKGKTTTVEVEDLVANKKYQMDCDMVLVSTGRKPYSEGLGLDALKIQKDEQGRILINDKFETSASNIYAVGDIVSGPMLAHKAEEEAVAAVEIMAGQKSHLNYASIPNVVYTDPEVASVGATEEELKQHNVDYKAGNFPFLANGRAKAMGSTDGFVKILAHAQTDLVLGVHIVGSRAGEMIAEAVTVIHYDGTSEDIARICHAHPTLMETVKEAALGVSERRIHL